GGHVKMVSAAKRLKHLSMFSRQLHVLVATGTPLVQALAAIERQIKDPAWLKVITELRADVEEGSALAEAMTEHRQYFDPISRSLVAAGEASGKLPEMLDRLASITRKQLHVRNTIAGAMVYPCLLMSVATGVLLLLMMFVLPRFAEMFKTMDMALPPTTALLMVLSDFLLGYWWTLPIALVVAYFGFRGWARTTSGTRTLHGIALTLPGFGKITRAFNTARIIRLMGLMLASSLPLLQVLKLLQASTANLHYRDLVTRAEGAVTRGEAISSAFDNPKLIDPAVCEAMRSGEASGQLGPLMVTLAEFLDEDNDVVIKSLTSILEPVILIVMGLLVGFVAVSMFMPLFDMTAMAGGGG
ncbi:MAG: type II secretion system F family protein, partial [Phycisphaerae bacterium]|nr:type II secretion system F family protein [Phycisphaerae bacterium]